MISWKIFLVYIVWSIIWTIDAYNTGYRKGVDDVLENKRKS